MSPQASPFFKQQSHSQEEAPIESPVKQEVLSKYRLVDPAQVNPILKQVILKYSPPV